MRHGFADQEKEKIDGEKAFVATPDWVEAAPQFSSGTTGTTPFSTPQQRSTVSTTGCKDGVHGFQGRQPMEMRLPKVKRTYGGILRAMWVTLAVCWVANLREAPEREKSRPRSRKPRTGKGKGKGKAKDGKSKDKDKDGGKSTENQNPVTPRTVRTTELSSPDFKKPMVTEPKMDTAEGKEDKPYSPLKEGEKTPMPASSGAQAQVLMALLKDVADGKSSAEDALKMAAKSSNESAAVVTPTTESKDVHKVGRQLAKAQAKTKKAYETLKKMKEDWATWTGQIQELYNRKVKQYEEAHRAWTLVLQDAITAEKNAKAELQALGKHHKDFKWDEVELEEKDFPEMFDIGTTGGSMEIEPTIKDSLEMPEETPPQDLQPMEPPKETFVQKLEAAAVAAKAKEKEQEKLRRKKKDDEKSDPRSRSNSTRKKVVPAKGKQGRLEFTPTPKGNSFAPLGDGVED